MDEQLYRALVQDPFGGMLVVPSGAAKRQAVDRMLKCGIVLLGDPVCTLDEMANNIFEDCCVSEISIGVEEDELIVRSVMDENRSSLSEFEPLWAGIGPTVTELRALFDTWRQFMVPPSVISSPGGNSVNDHILSIFEKYLDRTARSNLYNSVGVMECAIHWLKENRVSLKTVWMVGLNELNPLQRELVKAVRSAAGEMEFIVRNDGGKTFSEDLSWLEADVISVKECPKAEELTRFRHGTDIRARVFADPLTEARSVAGEVRRLISSGTSASENLRHAADEGEIGAIVPRDARGVGRLVQPGRPHTAEPVTDRARDAGPVGGGQRGHAQRERSASALIAIHTFPVRPGAEGAVVRRYGVQLRRAGRCHRRGRPVEGEAGPAAKEHRGRCVVTGGPGREGKAAGRESAAGGLSHRRSHGALRSAGFDERNHDRAGEGIQAQACTEAAGDRPAPGARGRTHLQ